MSTTEYQASNIYGMHGLTVADAPVDARRTFIRKTYTHLAAAVYAFVALEWLLFAVGVDEWMMQFIGRTPFAGLVLLGAFLVTSWVANYWAHSETSIGMQYAGLFLYVIAEALIFVPILMFAQGYAIEFGAVGQEVSIIPVAAITTLLLFAGLTAAVFVTRQDFSFLRTALWVGGFAAFALILAGYFVGLDLGIWFTVAMIILACGWILYDTSNVLHHYHPTQHVAASLALFASVALLFWYVLRLLMALSSRD
jgi:FtsH-binding integral membrane protein